MRATPVRRGGTNGLTGFIFTRLLGVALILFLISFLTFAMMHLAPGDLIKNLIGNRPANPEVIAQIRAQYHLDEPFLTQYFLWLQNALSGDLGTSIRLNEPVATILSARLGITGLLAFLSFTIAVVVSIPLGVYSAVRVNRTSDKVISGLGLFGLSAPSFAIGLGLLVVFSYYIPIFPVYGMGTGFIDSVYHLFLPALTLAIGLSAVLLRMTRAAMIRELASDYVTFARARGLSNRVIHQMALRNASIPVVTSAGLVLTYLVGGTILVETIYALPGLGLLMQESVLFKDIPVVQGLTLIIAIIIGFVTILVDGSYRFLDPRIRNKS